MKLRFDPVLRLSRNQITTMEDLYFVFIDEEGYDLPVGVAFLPSPALVKAGLLFRTELYTEGYVLRLYTTIKQAFNLYGDHEIRGLDSMRAIEQLFEGTYEDVGNRIFSKFRPNALEQWRSYKEDMTDEFVIEPKGKGHYSYFGFIRNMNSAALGGALGDEDGLIRSLRPLGRINHKRGRKYAISLFGFDWLTLSEDLSLKEARAVARSLADQDTFVDTLAKAKTDCVLEHLRNGPRIPTHQITSCVH